MGQYSQAGRLARLFLGTDSEPSTTLLLKSFRGAEAFSHVYRIDLELLSEDATLAPDTFLGKVAHVEIDLGGGETRRISGEFSRFSVVDKVDDLTVYRAELVPWLWHLSQAADCRVYQDQSAPVIALDVVDTSQFSGVEIGALLAREHPPLEYCVQYRESNLSFISRLLEEEGIFYYFGQGESRESFHIVDEQKAIKGEEFATRTVLYSARPLADQDVILSIERVAVRTTGIFTLRDYDYLQPKLTLEAIEVTGDPDEVYDYPGGFTTPDEASRRARLMLESVSSNPLTIRGTSTCRFMTPGSRIRIRNHFHPGNNDEFCVTEVHHECAVSDYRSWDESRLSYRNAFMAIPVTALYRPARRTPRPLVHGAQTATVVGKAGEEIWVDKHARVKVQFHWDRLGKKDEHSSCWVRVAQAWAGKGWGTIEIPRIGQEVLVDFLEGDPDRPIVTGGVYNALNTPPFPLPDKGMVSGVKSHSTPGGGGYNEISLDDTKGTEKITVHGEHDFNATVKHNTSWSTGANRSASVGGSDSESVGGNQNVSTGGNQVTKVGGDQLAIVTGNRRAEVHVDDTLTVNGIQFMGIKDGRQIEVTGLDILNAKEQKVTILEASEHMARSMTIDVRTGLNLWAGGVVVIQAPRIVLASDDGSRIEMGEAGIQITSPATIEMKGAMIKHN
jgi:type VI secretion system secreted protein VgrG